MERNVREFLKETGAHGLKARGVLSPHRRYNYLLQGVNVTPLIGVMRERGVTKLTSHDGNWFLTAEGIFSNPKSRESKSGLVKDLKLAGNVFWGQNAYINPFFDLMPEDPATRFVSSSIRPFARITFDPEIMGGKPCIRGLAVTVGAIVGMIAEGRSAEEVLHSCPYLEAEDIREALAYAAKKASQVNTYIFRLEVEQDHDGRWGADVPVLPGCNAWGYTKEEALEALRVNTQDFLEVMEEFNDPLPTEAEEETRSMSGRVVTVVL